MTSAERLPDDTVVVRGGLTNPETVQKRADEELDGTWGISVESEPGMTVRDLVREGNIPHPKIRVSTVGRIRALGPGFDVIQTGGPEYSIHHITAR